MRITVKFRMELLNFWLEPSQKNHGVHIIELVCLIVYIAEHVHCRNMNKWFENIPEFTATSSSLKLPLLTVKLSRVSRPSCIAFGLCLNEQRFKFAKPNLLTGTLVRTNLLAKLGSCTTVLRYQLLKLRGCGRTCVMLLHCVLLCCTYCKIDALNLPAHVIRWQKNEWRK